MRVKRARGLSKRAPAHPWAVAGVLLALFAPAPALCQTAAPKPAQAQPQIVNRVEAQAEAYRAALAAIPLEVQQTVRDYDATGHLKHTRHSSYRYVLQAPHSKAAKDDRGTASKQGVTFPSANLADGATLPFVFLPGSIGHLSLGVETPDDGSWILHFKSTPCPAPDLHHRWMGADISSQCVEGDAYLDRPDATLTRIRMKMADLPVFFHIWPLPVEVEVYELYNDTSFRLLKTDPGAPPRLVPVKSEYVLFTSRGRTVIDRAFEVVTSKPPSQQSR